jgi:hypothetical protein
MFQVEDPRRPAASLRDIAREGRLAYLASAEDRHDRAALEQARDGPTMGGSLDHGPKCTMKNDDVSFRIHESSIFERSTPSGFPVPGSTMG